MVKVAQYYNTACLCSVVGYAGPFRISELLSVKVKDTSCDGMSIFVSQRKNDQFRERHTSIIARSSKVSCPVSISERLLLCWLVLKNLVLQFFVE